MKGSSEIKTYQITYNHQSPAEVNCSPSFESHSNLYSERTLQQAVSISNRRRSSLLAMSGEREMTMNLQLDQMQKKITDSKVGTCKLIF